MEGDVGAEGRGGRRSRISGFRGEDVDTTGASESIFCSSVTDLSDEAIAVSEGKI